ncbi:vWA domain-containing protein [Thermus antranikianii]|uniref:VWA domain-containing protein n=1 Tax=Thermus antranikianii TaxID=88190 RepID=A0ABY7RSK6_9DEIN|nr:VWA domain-containing protein [Thermus antranikianii]WCM39821.1 VWA domain-containing protein [Thermus antranikianii]
MKAIRYSCYEGSLEDLSPEEILSLIEDFLLDSGFSDPFQRYDPDPERQPTLEDLYDALLEALLKNQLVPEDWLREARFADRKEETRLYQAITRMMEKLREAGYIRLPGEDPTNPVQGGYKGEAGEARFELTEKASDFLGLRSLRELLGALGRNPPGLHPTPHYAPGVEKTGETKEWEWGDPLELNVPETLKKAMAKGLRELSHEDLVIDLSEYTASMSTVVLLDCSHSMILYGEDRFTPAKKVALALAHLIRTQYPGDRVRFVLFHDTAEEIPLSRLPLAQVGPYHTNTKAGLELARTLLKKMGGEMRQIILITDGKPSAITLPSGEIYKNAWGLDPVILAETLKEATLARKEGIPIHTFMLAREPELLAFVKKLSQITRGKAYLTHPGNIGRYLLLDFLNKKVRRN